MFKSYRLMSLLGGVAAATLAGVFGASLAHAAGDATLGTDTGPFETCDGAVCLVLGSAGQDPANWDYSGFRPFSTNWDGNPLYTVEATQADGTVIDAGSYHIQTEDFWSPFMSVSQYHYGDFVPNADVDQSVLGSSWMGDLSGASVYSSTMFGFHQLTISDVGPHDATYIVLSSGDFTNTTVVADGASANFTQIGDAAPTFLWNSLFHPDLLQAQVPDFVLPADPFAGIDFDASEYLAGGVVG